MTPQSYVLDYLNKQHTRLSKDIANKRLNLKCLQACIAIYNEQGETHPSEYGAGESVKNATESLERCESEFATVCEALAWWESVAGESVHVVTGGGSGGSDGR